MCIVSYAFGQTLLFLFIFTNRARASPDPA